VASLALLVLAPVTAAVACAVYVDLSRPVLFRQVRPGRHGRPFVIVKFRTMRPPAPGRELEDDEVRLTRLGAFLRSTSLDEIPELLNVLRGDMSIVGPRPLLMEYVDRYTPDQARRNLVRPGVTGLAQVSGRNALSWEDKFRLDTEYVDRRSLWLDLRIMIRTVRFVLLRDGIDAAGEVGSPEFLGRPVAQASTER
jgi:lipopolysaccharide/colanic/teichoic acid biosynthesis glycosyltransferase